MSVDNNDNLIQALANDLAAQQAPQAPANDLAAQQAPQAPANDLAAQQAPQAGNHRSFFILTGLMLFGRSLNQRLRIWLSSTLPIRLKLGQWVFFTVIVALLPIGLDAIREVASGKAESSVWPFTISLISQGELALISAAITAEAIGHIFVSGHTRGCFNLFAFAWCCIIFFLSSGLFALARSNPPRTDFISVVSIGLFIGTLFAGGSCKLLAEVGDVI